MIEVKVEDKGFTQRLQATIDRAANLRPAMEKIGKHLELSVLENINQGGRPTAWKKNVFNSPLMNKSGALKQSIKIGTVTKDSVEVVAGGQTAPYAIYHHFGKTYKPTLGQRRFFFWLLQRAGAYNKNYAGGSGMFTIPQRRFMLFQNEDIEFIKNTLQTYLTKGE